MSKALFSKLFLWYPALPLQKVTWDSVEFLTGSPSVLDMNMN